MVCEHEYMNMSPPQLSQFSTPQVEKSVQKIKINISIKHGLIISKPFCYVSTLYENVLCKISLDTTKPVDVSCHEKTGNETSDLMLTGKTPQPRCVSSVIRCSYSPKF